MLIKHARILFPQMVLTQIYWIYCNRGVKSDISLLFIKPTKFSIPFVYKHGILEKLSFNKAMLTKLQPNYPTFALF